MQANGVAHKAPQAGSVERLERDVGALSDEQRMSAVMADAPELVALLAELQGSLEEVRSHVGPVLRVVSNRMLQQAALYDPTAGSLPAFCLCQTVDHILSRCGIATGRLCFHGAMTLLHYSPLQFDRRQGKSHTNQCGSDPLRVA